MLNIILIILLFIGYFYFITIPKATGETDLNIIKNQGNNATNKNFLDAQVYHTCFFDIVKNIDTIKLNDIEIKHALQGLKIYRLKCVNSLESLIISSEPTNLEIIKSSIDNINRKLLKIQQDITRSLNLPFNSLKPVPYTKTNDLFLN